VHLALVMVRHHTQFKENRRHTQRRIVGVPLFPGQAPRSLALMFFVVGILFLLGGLVQINPIWQGDRWSHGSARTAPSPTGTSAG
jgi:ubiquinol-cytochrome c reductase cytochrome b subunit